MRKAIIILVVVLFNMSLFSCTTSDLSEEIGIEELATEGEEGVVVPDDDDE
ncbi:hypothetical protein [Aquimarina mytili]|uniref:Secreted protein n=1 Tax=Aquimarina mytili TaxID=874423 RepID=A0A936ZNE9_9FLAO|nr:hypothetical protein [Aquimarina mytili]MBL0682829.1 hypothetical protein [Aquimarina mytili]